jgi:hypothetical protein
MSVKNEGTEQDTWTLGENGHEDLSVIPEMETTEKVFASAADFSSSVLELDTFYIKEIGKHVRLRYLTAGEVDRYRQSLIVGRGNNIQINQRGSRAKLAVMALANEDGTRLFQDRDIPEVMKWHSVILERISDRVKAKNGITDEDLGGDDAGN